MMAAINFHSMGEKILEVDVAIPSTVWLPIFQNVFICVQQPKEIYIALVQLAGD